MTSFVERRVLRKQILKLKEQGASIAHIAEQVGLTEQVVKRRLYYDKYYSKKRANKKRTSYKKRTENSTYMPKVNVDNVAYDLLVRVENSVDLISFIRFCQKLGAKGIQIK